MFTQHLLVESIFYISIWTSLLIMYQLLYVLGFLANRTSVKFLTLYLCVDLSILVWNYPTNLEWLYFSCELNLSWLLIISLSLRLLCFLKVVCLVYIYIPSISFLLVTIYIVYIFPSYYFQLFSVSLYFRHTFKSSM